MMNRPKGIDRQKVRRTPKASADTFSPSDAVRRSIPPLVFSVNHAGTDYSITMSRTAWEFREYRKPANCAFEGFGQADALQGLLPVMDLAVVKLYSCQILKNSGSWYSLEDLFENIKEHYLQTVYETLLSQFNEIKDRIGGYPVQADVSAGTHKVVQA